MPVLHVGSGKPFTTIPQAVAASKANDTIILDAMTHTLTTGVTISHPLTIRSVANGRATINYVAPVSGYAALSLSSAATIADVNFNISNCWGVGAGKFSNGSRVTNCEFGGTNFDGVQVQAAQNTTIDNCTFGQVAHYSIYSGTDGTTDVNGLTIRRNTMNGSGEHLVRIHSSNNVTIAGNTLHLEWAKYPYHGAALNIHDGSNFILRDNDIYGSQGYGPLAQDTAKRLINVLVENNRQHGSYLAIYAGTQGITINGGSVDADQSGSAIALNGPTAPQVPATGIVIENLATTYTGGKFLNTQSPNITTSNVSFNGALVG